VPHAYLSGLFAKLLTVTTVEDFEVWLSWNFKVAASAIAASLNHVNVGRSPSGYVAFYSCTLARGNA
jgi:hypothetical protein